MYKRGRGKGERKGVYSVYSVYNVYRGRVCIVKGKYLPESVSVFRPCALACPRFAFELAMMRVFIRFVSEAPIFVVDVESEGVDS